MAAIYGQGFYGVDTYGAAHAVDFKVDPVAAAPWGYKAIRVSWTSPTGSWDELRLLQSRTGWAADETDGNIVVDTTAALSEYVDTDLLPSTWYYYSLFIKQGGSWYLVGTTSALSVGNTGMADIMWDKIPRWFHYQPTNPNAPVQVWEATAEIVDPNGPWQENRTLKDFLGILGYGMDYLRTYESTLLWANDTKQAHLANVYNLSQTLGEEWEPRVPAYLMRQKVLNAGVLAQKRGTLAGLRELVATSVGYDIDISTGPNMFLNEDQAAFANPQYDLWTPYINYAVGDLVSYLGDIWKCILGAYGAADAPPSSGTSNTWWTKVSGTTTPAMVSDTLRNATTDAIVTWKGWVGSTEKPLSVAYGVSDPLDSSSHASNALWVRNTDGVTQDYTIVGAANPLTADAAVPGPDAAVLQGIPIPRLIAWDATVEYFDGDFVAYNGVAWEALRDNIGREPDLYVNDWKKVGYDERLPLKFSLWTHAGFTGVDSTGAGVGVNAFLTFFDGQGNPLATPGAPDDEPLLDTFNTGLYDTLPNRSFDIRPTTQVWSVLSGNWIAVPGDDGSGVAWSEGAPGLVLVTGDGVDLTYGVAVTFGPAPLSGSQGLILSASAETPVPTTYLRVTRTEIQQVSSGTVTASTALSTAITDWDRVAVVVDSVAKTATVHLNGSATSDGALTFTIPHSFKYGLQIF